MSEVLRAVQGDRLVFDIKLTQHNERYELGYDEKVYFNVFTRSYEPDFTSETVLYIEQESTTIKIDKIELDPGEYSFDAGIVFPDGTTKTVLPCIPNQKNTLYVYDKSCSNRDNIMGTIWDEAFDAKVKNPICSCYEIERIYKLIAQMDSNSFMTVQTRAELDNIPSDRIANGKLVRVEDNGNGHSEYFSYDTDTNRWLPEAFVQDGNPLIATFGTYSTDLSDDAYRYGVASGTEDKEEGVVEYIPNDYGYNHDIPADNSIYVNTTNGNIYKVHRETVINDYNTVIGYNVSYELVYNDNIPIRIITSMCARSLDYGIYKSLGINYLKLSTTSDSKINKDFYDKFTLYDIDEDAVNIFNRMLNISIMNTAPRDSLIDICSNGVSNLLIEYISSSETSYIKSQRISRILSLALIGYVPKSTRISNIPLYGDISRNDLLDSLGILYSLDCLPPDHVGGENDEAKYNDILNYGTMFFRQPGGKSDEYLSDKNSLYIVNQVSSHWGQGGLFLGSDIGYCKFISNSVPFYYSDENDPPESNNVLVYGKAINSTLNGNKYVYFIDTDRIGAQFYTIKDNEDRLFMLKSFSDTIDSNNFTTRSYEWERIALYKDLSELRVYDTLITNKSPAGTYSSANNYSAGDTFLYNGRLYVFNSSYMIQGIGTWAGYTRIGSKIHVGYNDPPTGSSSTSVVSAYVEGDIYLKRRDTATNTFTITNAFICTRYHFQHDMYSYTWKEIPLDVYSKTEVDNLILNNLLQSGIPSYSCQSYNYSTDYITVDNETADAIAALNDGQLFFISTGYAQALYVKNSNEYSGSSIYTSTRLALYSDIKSIRNEMKSMTTPISIKYGSDLAFTDLELGDINAEHNTNNSTPKDIRAGMFLLNNSHNQIWTVLSTSTYTNMGIPILRYTTIPIPVIRTDAIMKKTNKILVSQYSDIANVEEGQIFKYDGRYCVRTGHGEEYDYSYEDLSTGEYNLAHISDIPDNINKESGYVYDNALFSEDEGLSDIVINGTYVLEGDYCKIDAEATLVNNWAVVYYSLPVVAIATGCSIEHHVDGKQYSIRTMPQNGNVMNVLGIRRLDNSNLGSSPSSIHFHLEYKYR